MRAILQDVRTRGAAQGLLLTLCLTRWTRTRRRATRHPRSSERFNNIDAINAALRKIKYRGDQKLSKFLITEDDIGKISTLNKFLTKLDIFSTTLGGDIFVTPLLSFQ